MDSARSLGDLPGRRSCTEEAQVPLAPRRKLGLTPGQLAARGAAPAVSQYEIIDSDAILVCEEPSLTSFVASDRPSFRIHKVGLLFPPQEALEDDEHPWWYMTAR